MRVNKFLTIYENLVERIQSGNIKPNTKLPSENELVEQYGTSRETVRKALNLLSQNGYIQKIKGKGSFTLDVGKYDFPVSGLVSFKELAEKMGKPWKTIVCELDLEKPDPYIQKQLNINGKDSVWKIARARELENERIILDKDYVLQSVVPTLSKKICEGSLFAYLEGELGLKISFAKKEISVDEPTEEDYRYLDLKDYKHIVVVKNYIYLEDASLFQYTESRHRLDKFRFVDFARRGH
ncbi:trehalose operon repressor [Heyndrickxia oleronia]|uniref:Trehalose operon repressor n=1 Tax=Heyndrickxia oleronia TaxID=38875 RepID=A0A8E2IFL0_9BACI|nr:trehalose operon repressor [Heyndrickxia oleronia]MEC1377320.1 trehalose operon repressor [Heyndrickxia oleronia]OOP70205.1 trehalose operon repressor [Heyndrickxia oleronia]QQZ05964.1 trehalose operon repressor [Heyndrickxia oleronia]